MATSPAPVAPGGTLVRGGTVDELADVGVWAGRIDGADVLVQELEGEVDEVRAAVEALGGTPGFPAAPLVGSTADGAWIALGFADGQWLSTLIDPRRRYPPMPPVAVLTYGRLLADALELAWGDGVAPPLVRPDVRPVALRVGPDGGLRFGALRLAGRPPRDTGDTKGTTDAEDTRSEDLFLLGCTLYEMATRRRFGRGGTTAMVQRHHVQRRITAASAELDAFGERRAELVELLLSLVGPDRDPERSFASVSTACHEILRRIEGDGPARWAAAVFVPPDVEEEETNETSSADAPLPVVPTGDPVVTPSRPAPAARAAASAAVARGAPVPSAAVPAIVAASVAAGAGPSTRATAGASRPASPRPASFAVGSSTEELTPVLLDRVGNDEPTELPPRVAPPPPGDDATETSEELQSDRTPPSAVHFPRPSPLKIPAPSISAPVSEEIAVDEEEEEGLPENVIPLRGEARPGRRRGGLVPKALDSVDTPAAPAPRAAPRPNDAPAAPRRPSSGRRSPLLITGVAVVALVPLLALGGAWWFLAGRGGDAVPAPAEPVAVVAPTPPPVEAAPPAAVDAAPAEVVPPPPPPSEVTPPVTPAPGDPPAAAAVAPIAAPPPVAATPGTPPPPSSAAPKPTPPPRPAGTPSPPPVPAEARAPTPPPVPADGSPWTAPVATGPVLATFQSKPVGVLVTVDGAPRGTTPIQLQLSPGPHDLTYETDGKVFAREITVDPAGRNTWTLNTSVGKIE